jgi:glycosyltransferase involved in cell wall biosynthesis
MIPAYNCSVYLKDAILSVLQQDRGTENMQIEVVDDASSDANVADLVADVGRGRVRYFRQPQNVGSLRNFETCINRATGHYVHLMHGDDRLKPGFYNALEGLLKKYPDAGAAFCAFDMIREDGLLLGSSHKEANEPGILSNWLRRIAAEPRLQYVCMVVKREVYEKLGSFYLVHYGEDWEMWTRIAKHYPVAYTPQVLTEYRVQYNSITSNSFLTGQNVKDMAKVIEKNVAHLPEEDRETIRKHALKYYANDAINKAPSLWFRTKNNQAIHAQIKEALSMYSDVHLLLKVIRLKALMKLPVSWLPRIRKIIRGQS